MKPIKIWLETLPEPYRTNALRNMIPEKESIKVVNRSTALLMAFSWEDSKEGKEYWEEAFDMI